MRKRWLLIISCATFLALIYAARGIFISVSQQRPIDWFRQIGFEFLYWYVWAAFTPLVIWFAKRFDLQRGHWLRALLALAAFGLLIAPLQATIEFSLAYGIDFLRGVPAEEMERRRQILARAIAVEAFTNYIIYALIVCGHFAYDYYQKYREREMRSVELEGRLAQAELQNLKSQLHPHFLFNTLHTISILQRQDVELANRTLLQLSDLLRVSLDHTRADRIPLQQELDFLEAYLSIEKTRFQERLNTSIDAHAEARTALIPTFLLQPFVENALRHGIAPRAAGGCVSISARRIGKLLELTVQDDGAGLSSDYPTRRNKGCGIRNIEDRLRVLYSGDARLDRKST